MKILILSHNPITTYDAMGKTMASLFAEFKKEELCQLYIYPTIPDIDFCDSYYRITDKDVLNSYFKFSVKSRQINKDEIDINTHSMFENPADEAKYRNRKNKTALRLILRDLMWSFSNWYNKDLKKWLNSQKPTCVFVAPGTAKFLYNMAIKISKDFKIPIVSYICDEYYFVKKQKDVLQNIRVKSLRKKIKKLICKSSHIITICSELKELYEKEFNVPATVIMTGTNYSIAVNAKKTENPKSLTYMGNVRCNRFNSLVEIGQTLKKINDEMGTEFSLDIYTAEKDKGILGLLEKIDTIKLCGYVSGGEFDKVFHSADILVHTEAFDEKSIDLVKNSVSTKIADSLASGTCLLAYGPEEIASIAYLKDNDAAFVITEKDDLTQKLKEIVSNEPLREKIVKNALELAKKNHNINHNSKQLLSIIKEKS